MKFVFAVLAIALSLHCTQSAAQRRSTVSDDDVVQAAQWVATSGRIALFQYGLNADPALAELADQAVRQMEARLGQGFDVATYGEKIRIIVSAHITVSHVWRGYQHQSDPRAIIFLNQLAARFAITGRNATYAHELAHLLTWRFTSHSLREGLADYLALQVHPGAGVGPNPTGYGTPPPLPAGITDLIGSQKPAPDELLSDVAFRRAYYYASYRFVNALIQKMGLPTFITLYNAKDPEPDYLRLYGSDRQALIKEIFSQ